MFQNGCWLSKNISKYKFPAISDFSFVCIKIFNTYMKSITYETPCFTMFFFKVLGNWIWWRNNFFN